ncbi:hypothetical protein B0H12DRAFT_1118101 [Mycena haematopus]|nr:hypothetical protein B0H12DRAFT_1118101 [Mycena haematopus]
MPGCSIIFASLQMWFFVFLVVGRPPESQYTRATDSVCPQDQVHIRRRAMLLGNSRSSGVDCWIEVEQAPRELNKLVSSPLSTERSICRPVNLKTLQNQHFSNCHVSNATTYTYLSTYLYKAR